MTFITLVFITCFLSLLQNLKLQLKLLQKGEEEQQEDNTHSIHALIACMLFFINIKLNKMEIKGKIKKIMETQTFQSGFQKKEMVVTTQEQYPQDILIEFLQDKVALLDAYKVGDDVKVYINIRGKEWINPEGVAKYFNSINGWRIEKESAAPVAQTVEESLTDEGDGDLLPF